MECDYPGLYKKWINAKDDSDLMDLCSNLGKGVHLDELPRVRFHHSMPQPKTYPEWEHIPGKCALDKIYLGVTNRKRRTLTYTRFFTPYETHTPTLSIDEEKNTRYRRFTHEETRIYCRKMWHWFLTLLYGKEIQTSKSMSLNYLTRHVANLTALANYYQALENIAPSLERLLLLRAGIWKFVSKHPRDIMPLAYQLRSIDLDIEAAKHLIGAPQWFGSSVFTYSDYDTTRVWDVLFMKHHWAMSSDMSNFLIEAQHHMHESGFQMMRRLLVHIEQASAHIRGNSKDTPKAVSLAQLVLFRYVISGFIELPIDAQECTEDYMQPGTRWKKLWLCKKVGSATQLLHDIGIGTNVHYLNVRVSELAEAIVQIIKTTDVATQLDLFMHRAGPVPTCQDCRVNNIKDSAYTAAHFFLSCTPQEILENEAPSRGLCEKHQHQARYHDGSYHTTLHTWGAGAQSGAEPTFSWPPWSIQCYMGMQEAKIVETITYPARIEEIRLLGLFDVFKPYIYTEADLAKRSER